MKLSIAILIALMIIPLLAQGPDVFEQHVGASQPWTRLRSKMIQPSERHHIHLRNQSITINT